MESNKPIRRSVILEVPYKEKDEAKQLGARWDVKLRKWFVPAGIDPAPFERWFGSTEEQSEGA